MNRQEWESIAKALGEMRRKIEASWPPRGGYNVLAADVHDRKLILGARLEMIDNVARAMCAVLKSRSSRFDPERFLRTVGTKFNSR